MRKKWEYMVGASKTSRLAWPGGEQLFIDLISIRASLGMCQLKHRTMPPAKRLQAPFPPQSWMTGLYHHPPACEKGP